jgi:hypothetical protein
LRQYPVDDAHRLLRSFLREHLPAVWLIVSSAIMATAASNLLTSAFTGSDMVFHLLFEENCGLQQRSPRLM